MPWYESLRAASQIAYVRRRGRAEASPTLTGFAAALEAGPSRIVVTVSKPVGGAVVRNRVRRRIKGALDGLPAPAVPMQIVLLARPAAAAHAYPRIASDVGSVLERLVRGLSS